MVKGCGKLIMPFSGIEDGLVCDEYAIEVIGDNELPCEVCSKW